MSLYRRGVKMTAPSTSSESWRHWIWPVPVWEGRIPRISDHFKKEKTGEHRRHLGADITFKRLPSEPAKLPRGSVGSYVPPGVPVIASYPGRIWSALKSVRGHSVTIDHGNVPGIGPVVTFYQHLLGFSKPWKKGDIVEAGEVLGLLGGDLPPNYTLYHLHFELWFPKRGKPVSEWAVDPEPYMRFWRKVKMPGNGNLVTGIDPDAVNERIARGQSKTAGVPLAAAIGIPLLLGGTLIGHALTKRSV